MLAVASSKMTILLFYKNVKEIGYSQDGSANANQLLLTRAKVLSILSNILIETLRVLSEEIIKFSLSQQINYPLIRYGPFWVKIETKGSCEHGRVLKCKNNRILLKVSQ
jgi:hypothetical protein